MKNKLIQLLKKITAKYHHSCWANTDKIADYLLANGVIVPPCKVGDTVCAIFGHTILECEVATITVEPFKEIGMSYACYGGFVFDNRHIGKTVFLTREEAKQALKEREGK